MLLKDLQNEGKVVGYNFCDNFWSIPPSNPAKPIYEDGKLLGRMETFISEADLVTIPTDGLVEIVKKFTDKYVQVTPLVDPGIADLKVPGRCDDQVRILWTATPHHEDDTQLIAHAFADICKRNPQVRIVLFGYMNSNMFHLIPKGQMEFYEGVPVWKYESCLGAMDADIGVAPVIPHPFNFCKCLIGDTRIVTNQGLLKISDVDYSTEVYTGQDYYKPTELYKYPNVEVVEIKTNLGYTITGTLGHKIQDDKNVWKDLKDFKEGDKVKIVPYPFPNKELVEIKYPLLKTQNRNDFINSSSLPIIRIDENWGRLLGYLIGDGHIDLGNRFSITCYKEDEDVIKDAQDLWNSIGVSTSTIRKRDYHTGKVSKAYSIQGYSRQFTELAKYLGILGRRKILRVPECIWRSPQSVITEFLRGLFEADGTVSENGAIAITSKNEKLIEDIQILLLGFGISSRKRAVANKYYNRDYWTLYLNRESCDIFYEKIGFVSQRKSEILKKRVSKAHSNAYKPFDWIDEIAEITKKTAQVYDLTVENHQYIANGFNSHNSHRKWYEYSVLKIATTCTDYETYKHAEHMKTAYKVKKNKHINWMKGFQYLIDHPDEREKMAQRAYDWVMEHHNADTMIHRWYELYRDAYERKHNARRKNS
jgi:intein/homing endonuclease